MILSLSSLKPYNRQRDYDPIARRKQQRFERMFGIERPEDGAGQPELRSGSEWPQPGSCSEGGGPEAGEAAFPDGNPLVDHEGAMHPSEQELLVHFAGGNVELHDPDSPTVKHGKIETITFVQGDPVISFEWIAQRHGVYGDWSEIEKPAPMRLYRVTVIPTAANIMAIEYEPCIPHWFLYRNYAMLFRPGTCTFDVRKKEALARK